MNQSYTAMILDEIREEIDKIAKTMKVQQREVHPEQGYVLNRAERRKEAKRNKKKMKRGMK